MQKFGAVSRINKSLLLQSARSQPRSIFAATNVRALQLRLYFCGCENGRRFAGTKWTLRQQNCLSVLRLQICDKFCGCISNLWRPEPQVCCKFCGCISNLWRPEPQVCCKFCGCISNLWRPEPQVCCKFCSCTNNLWRPEPQVCCKFCSCTNNLWRQEPQVGCKFCSCSSNLWRQEPQVYSFAVADICRYKYGSQVSRCKFDYAAEKPTPVFVAAKTTLSLQSALFSCRHRFVPQESDGKHAFQTE